MNKYNGLLDRASAEYGILRGESEDESQWKIRIIYSILGRMALASLRDMTENEDSSIIHMKRRIETLTAHYKDMYPELVTLMPKDVVSLSDEIYEIYLNTGAIYHKPNRIVMAAKADACSNGIRFTRGYEIDAKQMVCGLGTYIKDDSMANSGALSDMYQLEKRTLTDRWKICARNASWKEFHSDNNIEYLRMTPPFKRGYWVDKAESNGKVSLLRTGFKESQLYYLYKTENGKIVASQLSQWQVEDYAYRSLANACLYQEGVLPPTTYRYAGDIVYVNFRYLPPPEELYLWKLYTWPASIISLPNNFKRVCTRSIFDSLKAEMQLQGYQFTEE